MAVILIAIGLLFSNLDFFVASGIYYPEFQIDGYVGGYLLSPSIQTYTATYALGNQVRIDLFPDAIGALLILVGVFMLLKYNKQYWFGVPFAVLSLVMSVLLRVSGFIEQGPKLVIWIIILYFLGAFVEIMMEYFVLYSTAGITDTLVNQGSNTRMLFGWWITVVCRTFIVFLNFVGHVSVSHVYQVVLVGATLFYLYQLIRSKEYVGKSEPVKISVRRRRDKKEKITQ